MNRFMLFLVAAGVAFAAGWLYGNEVRPPRLEDVDLAMWIVVGVAALALGAVASGGGR